MQLLRIRNYIFQIVNAVLKINTQFWTANPLEKTLMLGKTEGERRGWQRMTWFDSITDSMNVNLGKLWETVKSREALSAAVHGVAKSRIQLSDWTTTITTQFLGAPFFLLVRGTILGDWRQLSWKKEHGEGLSFTSYLPSTFKNLVSFVWSMELLNLCIKHRFT